MNGTTVTMQELVERYGVRVEVVRDRGAQLDDQGWEHHAYVLRVHFDKLDGRPSLDTPWMQGYGIEEHPTDRPDAILNALILDASSGAEDFEDFCASYGYDKDSRKAYATWEACARNYRQLGELLGEDGRDEALQAESL